MNDSITRLDYFAAHAPTAIPDWFKPEEPEYNGPAYPTLPAGIPEEDRKMIASWERDPCFDLDGEYAWFQQDVEAYRAAMRDHKERIAVERYLRWPWAYAKSMLLWCDVYTVQKEPS
jgi:hypothetical protein